MEGAVVFCGAAARALAATTPAATIRLKTSQVTFRMSDPLLVFGFVLDVAYRPATERQTSGVRAVTLIATLGSWPPLRAARRSSRRSGRRAGTRTLWRHSSTPGWTPPG